MALGTSARVVNMIHRPPPRDVNSTRQTGILVVHVLALVDELGCRRSQVLCKIYFAAVIFVDLFEDLLIACTGRGSL